MYFLFLCSISFTMDSSFALHRFSTFLFETQSVHIHPSNRMLDFERRNPIYDFEESFLPIFLFSSVWRIISWVVRIPPVIFLIWSIKRIDGRILCRRPCTFPVYSMLLARLICPKNILYYVNNKIVSELPGQFQMNEDVKYIHMYVLCVCVCVYIYIYKRMYVNWSNVNFPF